MAALVTDVGEQQIAQRINGAGTKPDWIGSGTDATAEAEGNTALGTEVETRDQDASPSVTTDTYTVVVTHTYGASFTIVEAGLLDASSGGNMYVRGTFGGITVGSGDKIEFTVDLQIT